MSLCKRICGAIGLLALAGALPSSVNAAMLMPGFYALHNHPDGSAGPPAYGLRLDGLDGTASHDFTFDFDYASQSFNSAMFLTLAEPSTGVYQITIQGSVWGGQDTGTDYANNSYRGVYDVFFQYTMGGQDAPGDDDIIVNPASPSNNGTIIDPNGVTHYLFDKQGTDGYSFRFGDENNDNGHRGFNGISGWGWLMHGLTPGDTQNIPYSDWLFTAEKTDVPTPGTLGLSAAAFGLVIARRRRSRA